MSFDMAEPSALDRTAYTVKERAALPTSQSGRRPLLISCLALALTVAACGDSRPADPSLEQREQAYNQIDPNVDPGSNATGLEEGALTPGAWTVTEIEGRPAVSFGLDAAAPLFTIGCDRRSGLILNLYGIRSADAVEMMEITIAGQTRRLAVNRPEASRPTAQASVSSTHDLFNGLRDLSSPLLLSAGDEADLRLPPDRRIVELVQKCTAPGGAASPPSTNVAQTS